MARFIIVNPDLPWIQGVLNADTAAASTRRLEALFEEPTSNPAWHVFVAPDTFPQDARAYSGGDTTILDALYQTATFQEIKNGKYKPSMAMSA